MSARSEDDARLGGHRAYRAPTRAPGPVPAGSLVEAEETPLLYEAEHLRISLGGAPVDLLSNEHAVRVIMERAATPGTTPLAVASANIDHIHYFGTGGPWHRFFQSVADQPSDATQQTTSVDWLVLLDGSPLVKRAAAITGKSWPRLAGSDLIGQLLTDAEYASLSVGFLGGRREMQAVLSGVLATHWPTLAVGGMWAPTREQINDAHKARRLANEVKSAGVDILFVGLGKPRQELWIAQNSRDCGARVLLAFGAAPDFLAGVVARAPEWMSARGAEWAWRLAKEPRRLARRYLIQGPSSYLALQLSSGRGDFESRRLPALPATERSSAILRRFTTSGRADVAAIVVISNSATSIQRFTSDLRQETSKLRIRLFVVDDGSTDETTELVDGYPDVNLIRCTRGGSADAVKRVLIENADSAAVLMMDPSVRLRAGCVAKMWATLSRSGAAVVVPRVLAVDGSLHLSIRRDPNVVRSTFDAILGTRFQPKSAWLSVCERRPEQYSFSHPVDGATASPVLMRSEVINEIGPSGEGHFIGPGQMSYLGRIRHAGYEIYFDGNAEVVGEGFGWLGVPRSAEHSRPSQTGMSRMNATLTHAAMARNGRMRSTSHEQRSSVGPSPRNRSTEFTEQARKRSGLKGPG